jgi:hypothetical protein
MNKAELKVEMLMEHLLLQNAIEVEGFDKSTGETVYSITDKLKEVAPEMYADLNKQFTAHMLALIDEGPKTMRWKINNA